MFLLLEKMRRKWGVVDVGLVGVGKREMEGWRDGEMERWRDGEIERLRD